MTKRPVLLQVILIALSAALFQCTFDIVYFHLGAIRTTETMAISDWAVTNQTQALGLVAIGLLLWKSPDLIKSQKLLVPILGVSLLGLVGLFLANSHATILLTGLILLFANGFITGDNLISVARAGSWRRFGTIAGVGLALGMIGEFIAIAIIGKGAATPGLYLFTAVLMVSTIAVTRVVGRGAESTARDDGDRQSSSLVNKPVRLIVLSLMALAALMFTIALVGIYRPRLVVPDLIERLAFMQGLLVIGAVVMGPILDWSRRSGAVIMVSSLMLALISVAFASAAITDSADWLTALTASLGYALLGAAVVFVTVAFLDVSSSAAALLPLAVAGSAIRSTVEAAVMIIPGSVISNSVTGSILLAFLLAPTVTFFILTMERLYSRPAQEARSVTREDRVQGFAAKHGLSLREREILELLLERKSNPQIATELYISENTAKFHVRNILQKTGCTSRRDIVDAVWGPGSYELGEAFAAAEIQAR